ncbi:Hypothetical predicted protein [Octopus vulgaris]|uniref:Uncharacterized protein n=1 Tax=Octopus vulgaris TaxID=6645 RepID=A0AA36AL91_OCTVU|nr:Hypothetical predicted protein [Octopus vulgaris]
MSNSLDCYTTVSKTIRRTFSIDSSLWLVDGPPAHSSLTAVRLCLKWLHLLELSFDHCLIAKSLLNLLDGLSLSITKVLAILDAISLFDVFCHHAEAKIRRARTTAYQHEKFYACAGRVVLPSTQRILPTQH